MPFSLVLIQFSCCLVLVQFQFEFSALLVLKCTLASSFDFCCLIHNMFVCSFVTFQDDDKKPEKEEEKWTDEDEKQLQYLHKVNAGIGNAYGIRGVKQDPDIMWALEAKKKKHLEKKMEIKQEYEDRVRAEEQPYWRKIIEALAEHHEEENESHNQDWDDGSGVDEVHLIVGLIEELLELFLVFGQMHFESDARVETLAVFEQNVW